MKTLKNYIGKVTIITHTKKEVVREVLAETADEAHARIEADIAKYDSEVRSRRGYSSRNDICCEEGSDGIILSVDKEIEVKEAE